MSTKRKVKARLNYDPLLDESGHRRNRIWSFPATAEAFDAMVRQGRAAIEKVIDVGDDIPVKGLPPLAAHAMIAALHSIGITRPKEGK